MQRYIRFKPWLCLALWLSMGLINPAHADDLQDADKLMDQESYAAAAQIYERMAEATNDIRALNMLAVMYSRGMGVARDPGKALEYAIRVDAAGSNAHTQGYISMLYMTMSPSDNKASYEWLKKATSVENIPGLFFRMGKYYEGGVGVPVNFEHAYTWYLMSTMPPEAKMDKYNMQKLMVQIKMSEMESSLSDEKIKAAAQLAENCFKNRTEACY